MKVSGTKDSIAETPTEAKSWRRKATRSMEGVPQAVRLRNSSGKACRTS